MARKKTRESEETLVSRRKSPPGPPIFDRVPLRFSTGDAGSPKNSWNFGGDREEKIRFFLPCGKKRPEIGEKPVFFSDPYEMGREKERGSPQHVYIFFSRTSKFEGAPRHSGGAGGGIWTFGTFFEIFLPISDRIKKRGALIEDRCPEGLFSGISDSGSPQIPSESEGTAVPSDSGSPQIPKESEGTRNRKERQDFFADPVPPENRMRFSGGTGT